MLLSYFVRNDEIKMFNQLIGLSHVDLVKSDISRFIPYLHNDAEYLIK